MLERKSEPTTVDGTKADDEQNVEDGRSDDGAGAHVRFRNEHTENGGEQFGSGTSGRHESGAGHVIAETELLGAHLETRQKVTIAHDRQTEEHVTDDQNVNHDEAS